MLRYLHVPVKAQACSRKNTECAIHMGYESGKGIFEAGSGYIWLKI